MKDYEVGITAPPFHCNCRSTTVPYFNDEFTQNEKRFYRDENGNTGYVDANINYSDWKENYIINKNKPYIDLTNSILKNMPRKYNIHEQQYFIDDKGNKYIVDGGNVKIIANKHEIDVANLLGKIYGGNIKLVPVVSVPQNIKTPDYIVNGEKYDLKSLTENNRNTIYNAVHKKKKQADNFIIDISKNGMSENEAEKQINNIYYSRHTQWIKQILLIKDYKLLKIYQRK